MTALRLLPKGVSAFVLTGLTAAVLAALVPSLVAPAGIALPLAGFLATGYGMLRYRPRSRAPWLLLGAASLLAVGHAGVIGYTGGAPPFPSYADGLRLTAYLCLGLGLLALAKPAPGQARWEGAIDGGVVTAGAVVAWWMFVVDPLLRQPGLDRRELLGLLLYAAVDLWLLTVAARTVFLAGLRSVATLLVMSGVAVLLVSTTAQSIPAGRDATAGWLVASVLLAAAALHPSMAEAGGRATPSAVVVSPARLRMYMLLTLLIPALTVTGVIWHSPTGVPAHRIVVPLLASAAMSVLLLLRVSQLAAVAQRRACELDERTVALGTALREQEALQQELRHRALHDPLTALGNRALLNERLAQALCRIAPARLHGLYLLDLDGFKDINDTLGHPAGDELLVEVADRLRRAAPDAATLARLGGDEFAIILVNSTMWELRSTADGVLTALRAPYRVAGQLRGLTTSVGLRVVSAPMRPTDALRDADIALYEAKAAGKNQIRVFTDAVGAAA